MTDNKLALISADELTLAGSNVLKDKQLEMLLKPTPKQYLKTRPAKGGGVWSYVTGGYIRKMLNLCFGWDWDFQIVEFSTQHGEAIVKGRLTVRNGDKTIIKEQFGNKEIICKRNTTEPLSIGNDLKAAATDALKKCAAEMGFAADIYNAEDFKAVKVKVSNDEVINQKEHDKITLHIMTAASLDDLEQSEEFLLDDAHRNLYRLKKEMLCK